MCRGSVCFRRSPPTVSTERGPPCSHTLRCRRKKTHSFFPKFHLRKSLPSTHLRRISASHHSLRRRTLIGRSVETAHADWSNLREEAGLREKAGKALKGGPLATAILWLSPPETLPSPPGSVRTLIGRSAEIPPADWLKHGEEAEQSTGAGEALRGARGAAILSPPLEGVAAVGAGRRRGSGLSPFVRLFPISPRGAPLLFMATVSIPLFFSKSPVFTSFPPHSPS